MAEIEQQGHTSRSLQAKVLELQQGLARRAHAAEARSPDPEPEPEPEPVILRLP